MRAASEPAQTRQHGNFALHNSTVKFKSNTRPNSPKSPKMVMPPFLRLDSTGEASPDDGPAAYVMKSQRRMNAYPRQGASTTGVNNGFLGKLVSQVIPQKAVCASNQLTATPQMMMQGGLNTLDQLLLSRQVADSFAASTSRQAMRSPVKTVQFQKQAAPVSLSVMMARNFPWLPQGVFPCHVFDALQAGAHQFWSPPVPGQFSQNTGMPQASGTLFNTCEQFVAQQFHRPHPVYHQSGSKAMHEREKFSPSVNLTSPVVDLKSESAPGVSHALPDNSSPVNCDRPSFNVTGPDVNSKCTSPVSFKVDKMKETHHQPKDSSASQTHTDVQVERPIDESEIHNDNATSHSTTQHNQTVPTEIQIKMCPQNNVAMSSTSSPKHVQNNESLTSTLCSTVASNDCKLQTETISESSKAFKKNLPLCMYSNSEGEGLSGWSEVDVDTDTDSSDDDDVDEDDSSDDSDNESENEIDPESQAEALNYFNVLVLCEANLLCKKSKQREAERKCEYSGQKKSPPKPNHEANRRWDKHHPNMVPDARKSKVQFSCGQDVDQVRTFERDTLTVMEIQKQRDISKQHNGRARQLLRTKSFKADSDEDDSSISVNTSSSGSVCSDSSDVSVGLCNGVSHAQVDSGLDSVVKDSEVKHKSALKVLKYSNDFKKYTDDDSEDESDGVLFWSEGSYSTESEKEDEEESDKEVDHDEELEEDDDFVIEFKDE